MRLMSNNFIILQKQSKEVFCFFRIPWNVIKIHLQAHRHKVPPVCSMRSNEKTRTWASRKGRDMTCCRLGGWVGRPAGSGGQAVAYLSIPVPTNLRQAICFQLDTNQEMAPLKYPIGSNETYTQKSKEQHHGPASSHEKCHSWTSKGTTIVIF